MSYRASPRLSRARRGRGLGDFVSENKLVFSLLAIGVGVWFYSLKPDRG